MKKDQAAVKSGSISPLANPDKIPAPVEMRNQGEELPDVRQEVRQYLEELKERDPAQKKTVLVSKQFSSIARRNLHYDIMTDIESRIAGVTIGELLKDSPKYRKVLADAMKVKRRKRLPVAISDMKFIEEEEDWGAPQIDLEIEGCLIKRVPVDGGAGVNVMSEQTAADLGYTNFEKTPKILRMANQVEVIPLGKLSRVPTRMGELEYLLNYIIIRLPTPSVYPVLLGRPWLYQAGVLEDWKRKEFRIGKVSIPWEEADYQGETTGTSSEYTTTDSEYQEQSDSDCWMIVDAVKSLTEEECGFNNPTENWIVVEEEQVPEEEDQEVQVDQKNQADQPDQEDLEDQDFRTSGSGLQDFDTSGIQDCQQWKAMNLSLQT